ncbi:uncharacterized protein [Watersipora subatra]|uniref:uncharacterized protein n=1 Tax=Watersipora subatra TaxID=2589382 RepID=UPI00355BD2F8
MARSISQEIEINWSILAWIPNIIGYLRITLCILSILTHSAGQSLTCLFLFALNFCLDGLDGYVARRLGQSSSFGAWFDVYVDLLSRGFLWILVEPVIGYSIISWEWVAFFSIHNRFGEKWKTPPKAPAFVSFVMKKNFKTPHGCFVIGSLFLLPMWCYAQLHTEHAVSAWLPISAQLGIYQFLVLGRIVAASVELWYIGIFIQSMLITSTESKGGS